MKAKHGSIIILGMIFFISCGQNSTEKVETAADSIGATGSTGDNSTVIDANTVVTTTPSVTVPDAIQAKFREKYPDVRNVSWSRHEALEDFDWDLTGWPIMDTADFLARFNYNGSDYWAWYDSENNGWVSTVARMKDFTQLPKAVQDILAAQYKDYTIEEVDQEFDRKRTAFEIDLSKGNDKVRLRVDENGNVMKNKSVIDEKKTKEKIQ